MVSYVVAKYVLAALAGIIIVGVYFTCLWFLGPYAIFMILCTFAAALGICGMKIIEAIYFD